MRWNRLLFLAVVISRIALTSNRAIAAVTVSPVNPTTSDSISVRVSSGFRTLCWFDTDQSCITNHSDTLSVIVTIQYCSGAPMCNCGQFPRGYDRTCHFGPLPVGSYIASFTELHINPNDPASTFTQYAAFTVTSLTPTVTASWGRLKLHYH
jgi:hypothetical protein